MNVKMVIAAGVVAIFLASGCGSAPSVHQGTRLATASASTPAAPLTQAQSALAEWWANQVRPQLANLMTVASSAEDAVSTGQVSQDDANGCAALTTMAMATSYAPSDPGLAAVFDANLFDVNPAEQAWAQAIAYYESAGQACEGGYLQVTSNCLDQAAYYIGQLLGDLRTAGVPDVSMPQPQRLS